MPEGTRELPVIEPLTPQEFREALLSTLESDGEVTEYGSTIDEPSAW